MQGPGPQGRVMVMRWVMGALLLLGLGIQSARPTTYTIGDPEYLKIFTQRYHMVWTQILSQGGYMVCATGSIAV